MTEPTPPEAGLDDVLDAMLEAAPAVTLTATYASPDPAAALPKQIELRWVGGDRPSAQVLAWLVDVLALVPLRPVAGSPDRLREAAREQQRVHLVQAARAQSEPPQQ